MRQVKVGLEESTVAQLLEHLRGSEPVSAYCRRAILDQIDADEHRKEGKDPVLARLKRMGPEDAATVGRAAISRMAELAGGSR